MVTVFRGSYLKIPSDTLGTVATYLCTVPVRTNVVEISRSNNIRVQLMVDAEHLYHSGKHSAVVLLHRTWTRGYLHYPL